MTAATGTRRLQQLSLVVAAVAVAAGGCDASNSVDNADVASLDGGVVGDSSIPADADPSDADRRPDTQTDTTLAPADAADGALGPVYGLSEEPYTTLQGLWAPRELPDDTIAAIANNELNINDIDRFEEYGIGVDWVAGQPWVEHNELAPEFDGQDPAARRSLLYFWESADPQLIDEESPIRFAGTTIAPFGSTYRPQSHLVLQAYESQVRSARRISQASGRPFDFAFVAGDMTDGGQQNELDWTAQILAGGLIDPDSGVDDDPRPGPGNDFTDPFVSAGIGVPWYPAVGNHETLYSGLLAATASIKDAAVGDEVIHFADRLPVIRNIEGVANGYRDGSTPNADVVTDGQTPADPRRRILDLSQVLSALHEAPGQPAGHGLDETNLFETHGYYSFHPLPDKPVRFIVLNTLNRQTATANGGIRNSQFQWLDGQLRQAERAGEVVIVGSHHKSSALGRSSDTSTHEFQALLASYDNVILHVAGHGHHNSKELIQPDGDHRPDQGYWEIMCASTVDFPMQTRVIELVYEGDGYLSVYVTNLEQNAALDTMGHRALELAAGRNPFIDGAGARQNWENRLDATNLLLRFKLPDAVVDEVESAEWPTRVESEQTLLQLDGGPG